MLIISYNVSKYIHRFRHKKYIFCSRSNIICFICFQVVASLYLVSKLYVRMHTFILGHHQLSIDHQGTHPKKVILYWYCKVSKIIIIVSKIILSSFFLVAGGHSDIIGHVHGKVLEPPCFLSTKRLLMF